MAAESNGAGLVGFQPGERQKLYAIVILRHAPNDVLMIRGEVEPKAKYGIVITEARINVFH